MESLPTCPRCGFSTILTETIEPRSCEKEPFAFVTCILSVTGPEGLPEATGSVTALMYRLLPAFFRSPVPSSP